MKGPSDKKDGRRKPTLLGMPTARALPNLPALPQKGPVEPGPREGQSDRPSATARISDRPSLVGLGWIPDEQPSVLLVGEGHPMQEALGVALARHKVESEVTSVGAVLDAVVAATPKLVLILGDAAQGSGKLVLGALRSAAIDETVPIAVLLDDTSLEARLEAIRQGATAVIPRSASADQIARRIVDIVHAGVGRLKAEHIGDTMLSELLGVLGKQIAQSVAPLPAGEAREDASVRLSLARGQDLVELLDDFTVRLRTNIIRADRADRELDPADGALLGEGAVAEAKSTGDVSGLRVVLADDDSGRADGVAEELRRRGATVVVTGLSPPDERMVRLQQVDPMVLLMRSEDVPEKGHHLIDQMKADHRLRWATLVTADWDELRGPGETGRVIETLIGRIAMAGDAERAIVARAETGAAFDVRLEGIGPARALRALSGCSRPVRMVVDNPRVRVVVDLSEGLVVGTKATVHDDPPRDVEGPAALAALMMLGSGRVTVEPIAAASVLNVMSTVESALAMAETESPPLVPSLPPPHGPGLGDASRPRAAGDGASAAATNAPASRRTLAFAVLAGLALITIGFAVGRALGSKAVAVSQSAPHASSQVTMRADGPAKNASVVPAASLAARAKGGDLDAIAALEQRPVASRTVEETLALAEGRTVSERRGVEELRRQCSEHLELLEDPRTARRWLTYARNSAVAGDALAALASLPSSIAADLVYEVWVGTEGRTAATQIAREIIYAPSLRKLASPALSIALDLRATESCDGILELLPRAIEVGDKRSLLVLARLNGRRNCGPTKTQDCYPCLRKSAQMSTAIRATRDRSAPAF